MFDVLTLTGNGSARSMASGIAKATIPTLAGMFVAIVGLLLQSQLNFLINKRQQQLTLLLPFNKTQG